MIQLLDGELTVNTVEAEQAGEDEEPLLQGSEMVIRKGEQESGSMEKESTPHIHNQSLKKKKDSENTKSTKKYGVIDRYLI